jgi:hypothetical protein
MQKINKFAYSGMSALAVAALVALSPSASAIPLTWITPGLPENGLTFAGGAIQIKAVNYDTGALYAPMTVGTALGFGNGPGATSGSVAAGQTALNGQQTRAPNGAVAGQNDSWGILRIEQIQATASNGTLQDIYNRAVSPFELTAMFWGVQDFYLNQVSAGSNLPGGGQIIDGTGLRVDIYSDLAKNFNQTPGPTGLHTVNTYPTATDGTLELSLLSTPGFINNAATLGGIATEFESNTANTGYAALNVIGGASAAQFNTNGIGFSGSSGGAFSPGLGNQTSTDIWFSFTSTQGTNGWDITSNDPMLANIGTPGVPDSGSTLLLLGMGVVFVAGAYRRRQAA